MLSRRLPRNSTMRSLLLAFAVAAPSLAQTPAMTNQPIVIHADRIIDGRGKVIPGGSVTVQGDKISKVDASSAGAATYDLKGLTLLPGLIDAHSHLSWYFNSKGRYHTNNDGDTPAQSIAAAFE